MAVDLSEKCIVITGASSGIGRATAVACARAGMDVVINARREARLRALADEIEATGRGVEIVTGDVVEPGISERMLEAAEGRFGGFHAVFANAGYGMDRAVVDTSMEQLRGMFDVNFFASVELLRAAARRLSAAGRPGHLLMCSSCLAKFTLAGHSAYSATKAAQNHVCRAMSIELERSGIRVSSVHPITTRTEFFEASRAHGGEAVASGQPERPAQDVPDHAARGFVQTPERVAAAVVSCLRRPRPEVWTSFTVRAVSAAMTMFPRFLDVVMRRAQ